jgi:hypothetical protein
LNRFRIIWASLCILIALTLLGLDVVGLVHGISKSEDFNATLFENWPTFLAYVLGFFVLFSW